MSITTGPITAEELLAMPDNGMERWLVAGELREQPMTVRNRFHSRAMTRLAQALANWLDGQPFPKGQVLTGDAGIRISAEPDSLFGMDVAFVSAEMMARQKEDALVLDGAPTLAVEILSPSDTMEAVNEKIDAYLDGGVPLVWIIDPHRRTVTAHRPGEEPVLFNARQELTGEPQLPGFRVAVSKLFE